MNTTSVRAFARPVSSLRVLVCVSAALALFAAPRAYAQAALDSGTVPIVTTVVPGQPIDLFFSEVPDNIHQKDLLFQGMATTPPGTVGQLDVQFDWFDPNAGGFVLSPVFPVVVPGATTFSLPFSIPFCPPEISLHLVNSPNAAGVPIFVDGTFSWRCVPEPSTFALGAIALGALACYRLRRRAIA